MAFHPPMPLSTILVGVDGSAEAERAGSFAAALANTLGARIFAVHATQALDRMDAHELAVVMNQVRGPWTDSLRAFGARPDIVLREGPPALVLLVLAEALDADLVVVGTRGAGQLDSYDLGSTAAQLIEHCTRPVTVVPALHHSLSINAPAMAVR